MLRRFPLCLRKKTKMVIIGMSKKYLRHFPIVVQMLASCRFGSGASLCQWSYLTETASQFGCIIELQAILLASWNRTCVIDYSEEIICLFELHKRESTITVCIALKLMLWMDENVFDRTYSFLHVEFSFCPARFSNYAISTSNVKIRNRTVNTHSSTMGSGRSSSYCWHNLTWN